MRRDRPVSRMTHDEALEHRTVSRGRRVLKRPHLLRSVFALIGVAFVLVELARYAVVPLLVWLGSLSGGGV